MRRRTIGLISTLVLGLLAGPLPIEAQQAGKVHRIGFLISASGDATEAYIDAFQQGLRELGYVEGTTSSLKSAGARQNAIDCPISPLS